ncbi:IS3 family transposase, partial [Ralstonia pseudosolanacearum]|uniref:IS3 family transposase n=1 Tax=Ralstonia pseudosolanacearum TaxID=1310165 RepID=UPI003D16290A
MMKDITGKQFGINKIRRLKRKYGIICPVRQPSVNRKAARELMVRNRKANILKRTFRMHRPNEAYLSDVTYLNYGNNQTAYGSAVIDAVTGKLTGFVLSDHNDLALADSTLDWLKIASYSHKALFHTDQGSLYMSDQFQRKLKKMGFQQSMSKRGNCWDNAPQESFFGHFKDEVDYRNCRNIVELEDRIWKYAEYYNFDRPQWTRNRMAPIYYQLWLQSLSEEEFSEYLENEKMKYEKMKEKAAVKAIERAKTLGV